MSVIAFINELLIAFFLVTLFSLTVSYFFYLKCTFNSRLYKYIATTLFFCTVFLVTLGTVQLIF